MATRPVARRSTIGAFGLKALEPDRITARQIEAARRAITRHIKRQGRLWIRIFPDVPVSSKPAEVRMGSGKGSPEFWAARVKPGRILFELDGVPGPLARVAFERAMESCRSRPRSSLASASPCTRKTKRWRRLLNSPARPMTSSQPR
jgi:ribosomal protein L16